MELPSIDLPIERRSGKARPSADDAEFVEGARSGGVKVHLQFSLSSRCGVLL